MIEDPRCCFGQAEWGLESPYFFEELQPVGHLRVAEHSWVIRSWVHSAVGQ